MRRDTVKYIALLFCLTLVIPFLSGCNDTDDVQKIFTGKTWKMTYITKKNEHTGINLQMSVKPYTNLTTR